MTALSTAHQTPSTSTPTNTSTTCLAQATVPVPPNLSTHQDPQSPLQTPQKKRPKEAFYNIFSQNLQGAKDELKLECIIHSMRRHHIDIYLIQETWLTGNWTKDIHGYTLFHHGLETATCSRGTGGVGIILSPRMKTAWTNAGNPPPIYGGILAKTARFIGLQLIIKPPKSPERRLYVCSAYHPCAGPNMPNSDIDSFYDTLPGLISAAPPSFERIIGCDTNAALGIATSTPDLDDVLGNFGLPPVNTRGETIHNILRMQQLQVPTTKFKHRRYDSWTSNIDGSQHQLDHFFTDRRLNPWITDAKYMHTGSFAPSDHPAIKLKLCLIVPQKTQQHATDPRPTPSAPITCPFCPDYTRLTEPGKIQQFQDTVEHKLTAQIYECVSLNRHFEAANLSCCITEAAECTILKCKQKRTDWFS